MRPRLALVPPAKKQDLILVGSEDDGWYLVEDAPYLECPSCGKRRFVQRRNGAWKCKDCLEIGLPMRLTVLDAADEVVCGPVVVPCRFDRTEDGPAFNRGDIVAGCAAHFDSTGEAAASLLCEVAGFDSVRLAITPGDLPA